MRRRITILSAGMGAGHDAVAGELVRRLRARGHETATIDVLRLLPAGLGAPLRRSYQAAVQYAPWLYEAVYQAFFTPRRRPVASTSPLVVPAAAALAERLAAERPDTVVSTFHLAAQMAGRLREKGVLRVPSVVVVTDFAAHRQWYHPCNDLHLCPTRQSAAELLRMGAREASAVGPVVPEAFFRTDEERSGPANPYAREFARRAPDRPPVLVSSGAWGVGARLERTAALLAGSGFLPVVLCGRNEALRRRLAAVDGVLPLGTRKGACRTEILEKHLVTVAATVQAKGQHDGQLQNSGDEMRRDRELCRRAEEFRRARRLARPRAVAEQADQRTLRGRVANRENRVGAISADVDDHVRHDRIECVQQLGQGRRLAAIHQHAYLQVGPGFGEHAQRLEAADMRAEQDRTTARRELCFELVEPVHVDGESARGSRQQEHAIEDRRRVAMDVLEHIPGARRAPESAGEEGTRGTTFRTATEVEVRRERIQQRARHGPAQAQADGTDQPQRKAAPALAAFAPMRTHGASSSVPVAINSCLRAMENFAPAALRSMRNSTSSPGRSGRRNFTCGNPTTSMSNARRVDAATRSRSTTPGTTGAPGKCPGSAGCDAAMWKCSQIESVMARVRPAEPANAGSARQGRRTIRAVVPAAADAGAGKIRRGKVRRRPAAGRSTRTCAATAATRRPRKSRVHAGPAARRRRPARIAMRPRPR